MNSIKVLFFHFPSKEKCEEYNFILSEVLPKYQQKNIKFCFSHDVDQINEVFDVFVYPCRHHKLENYYGFAPVLDQVINAVEKFKPKIIIQLYDESAEEYMHNHLILSKYCKLFLKQYKHPYHIFPENVIHLPLGYLNKFSVDLNNIKLIKERKYFWGWSGHIKNDRSDMLNSFLNHVWKGVIHTNTASDVIETSKLYKECIFVPCGRGNYTLDCWRIYEAIVSGAIPVVVGSLNEIKKTFEYKKFPPFIYDESWYNASQKCVKLIEKFISGDDSELQNIQNNLIEWWNYEMNYVQKNVLSVLNED